MKLANLKVIIIEDDYLFSTSIENWLKDEVKSVKSFNKAEDGIDPITEEQPDIIFLDNLLPGLKGREVLELYKVCSPESTIIIMSSIYSVDEIAKSIQNKADFLVDKNELSKEKLFQIIQISIKEKGQQGGLWNSISAFTTRLLSNSNKQIAIVEDDEIFATRLEKIIKGASPTHDIRYFTDVTDFYSYCEHANPNVIFLDYNFPDANGMDVLLFIRNVLPKSKVVIISSQEKPDIALKLVETGILSYIVKDENWTANLDNILQELDLKQ